MLDLCMMWELAPPEHDGGIPGIDQKTERSRNQGNSLGRRLSPEPGGHALGPKRSVAKLNVEIVPTSELDHSFTKRRVPEYQPARRPVEIPIQGHPTLRSDLASRLKPR